MRLPSPSELLPLRKRFPKLPPALMDLLEACLRPDPRRRPTAAQLMQMPFFSDSQRWLSEEFWLAQVPGLGGAGAGQ